MVQLVLSISLLVLTSAAALAAFGGETWRKGDEPLRTRITRRGWTLLSLLFATLLVGVAKEVYNIQIQHQERKRAEEALAAAAAENQGLRRELEDAKTALSNEIRATARGPMRVVFHVVAQLDGQEKQALGDWMTSHQLTPGDTLYYVNNCRRAEFFADGNLFNSSLGVLLNGQELRLRNLSGALQIKKHNKNQIGWPTSPVLLNPKKFSGCAVEFFAYSNDPLRQTSQTVICGPAAQSCVAAPHVLPPGSIAKKP